MPIIYRSDEEIGLLIEANMICRDAVNSVAPLIKPGVTTLELDSAVEDIILACGAQPSFKEVAEFNHASCISVNNVGTHGIPSSAQLRAGDTVSIDVGAIKSGFHGDFTQTFMVSGGDFDRQRRSLTLRTIAQSALGKGVQALFQARDVSEVGVAIEKFLAQTNKKLRSRGYTYSVDKGFTGHGIGTEMHMEPDVPHSDFEEPFGSVKPGLVVAIEPLINDGGLDFSEEGPTGWDDSYPPDVLSAKYEVVVAVVEDGLVILPYADRSVEVLSQEFGIPKEVFSNKFQGKFLTPLQRAKDSHVGVKTVSEPHNRCYTSFIAKSNKDSEKDSGSIPS